ncbi:Stk1 family PASTA domain-containing Ser/Thr kinase [Priestia megaterium]|nr:Stk1 family PASTA domain-containing Ser/Thr kinase [Priestia megaterium]
MRSLLIGRRLNDRYKILHVIGGGGMANVYLARDMILDRDVAIKVLRLDFANDEAFIKRFHREAQSATSIAHPNIVSIYDVGEEEDIYYIVMEYVPGMTLKQYILQESPLSLEKAIHIMTQITSAIAHAHQFGIIHRDIKPQNILIDHDDTVKVTDFGIAVALSSTTITHTNSVLGSVHYLSPEQARGGLANKKSDIYSLGVVLFELLTGRVPFSGESAVSIALKHLQTETPSPKKWNVAIPQSVENVVLKATTKDPFYRYNSVEELEEDLRSAVHPNRHNEQKFIVPDDDEVTKAIPVIKDNHVDNETQTLVRKPPHLQQEEEGEEKKPKKKKKSKLIFTLIVVFLLLAAASVAAVTFIPSLLLPKDITVPDLHNQDYEVAVTELVSLGFNVENPKEIADNEVSEGNVIRTVPKAGNVVKEGSDIVIYRSTGKAKVAFDRLIGRNTNEVEKLLENRNYREIRTIEIESDEVKGTILDQNPKEGEEVVPESTTVTLWVSKGPPAITVKDFLGWTEKSVRDYSSDQDLKVVVENEYSDTVEKGLVISQTPNANSVVQKGDTLTIKVSLGKKEKPPQTVGVQVTIPYEVSDNGTVEGDDGQPKPKPQKVQIYVEDANTTMSVPIKELTITETVTESFDVLIKDGEQAIYKIVRDGQVIEEKTVEYPEE